MKILVTGAKGFVGRNLVSQLYNIRDGKARNYGIDSEDLAVYEYDIDSDPADLEEYCKNATEYTLKNGGKPWRYHLLRHDVVERSSSFEYLMALS